MRPTRISGHAFRIMCQNGYRKCLSAGSAQFNMHVELRSQATVVVGGAAAGGSGDF